MRAMRREVPHEVDRGERRALAARESEWVARAKEGDAEAFAAIFQHYRPRIHSFCYRTMGDATDADDLTQETFLKAYNALHRTTADLALNAWLHRIAANACTDLLRRRRTARAQPWEEQRHDRPSHHREDDPESALIDAEGCGTIAAAMRQLSPRHYHALLLRTRDARSPAEIGETLALSGTAVKSLLFRARREFGKHYRP